MTTREPGWNGMFTRDSILGAIRNGTRVRKTRSEPGDTHKDGDMATVLGSVSAPEVGFGYFVEWDSAPRCAVFVVAHRIEVQP